MSCLLLILLVFPTVTRGNIRNEIKIMTYNVWNFDSGPNWERRKMDVGDIVKKTDVDFVAWQELRKDSAGRDMMRDLKELLSPDFKHHGYVTGEKYADSEEGVGFSSRLRVLSTETKTLSLGKGSDSNHRACIRVVVELPNQEHLTLFVAHFSFDRKQQLGNAKELKTFALTSSAPQIILGDLNIYNDYDAPIRELSRIREPDSEERVLFQDAWTLWQVDRINDPAAGYTFSSWKPHNRADRILVRGPGIWVSRADVLGRASAKSEAASDHMALVATLQFEDIRSPDSPSMSVSETDDAMFALPLVTLGSACVLLSIVSVLCAVRRLNRCNRLFVGTKKGSSSIMSDMGIGAGKYA